MRVGIDARFYGSVGKGLGRYTEKLIKHLESLAGPTDEFFIFLKKENFEEYVPASPSFRKVLADYPWYGFGEQLGFPALLRRYSLDLVHFPHFNVPLLYSAPFVVTIHDLILLRYPTFRNTTRTALLYRLKFLAYRLTIASAVRRARTILTVSHFTKTDIEREYPSSRGRVVVAYEGSELRDEDGLSPDRSDASQEEAKSDILSPYFLYVGNAYPHKNLELFIPLARKFLHIRFVLVGRDDFFYRRFRKLVSESGVGNIVFVGYKTDTELESLYRGAVGYIFPSLYEGFGLPPLEAMRFGTPVIASSRGALPEVLGDAALFADPEDIEGFARHAGALFADEAFRRGQAERGMIHAKGFTWRSMAVKILDCYREVLKK